MNQMSPFRVNPGIVGGVLEGAGAAAGVVDRLTGLAWLLILEEAEGVARAAVADNAKVGLQDLEELRHYVVWGTGFGADWDADKTLLAIQSCDSIWLQGIAAVRTSAMMTQQAIGSGWDQVEAMAIDKVAAYLSEMRAVGDPLEMLEIATKANRAIRRGRGEGGGRGNGGFGMAGANNGNGGSETNISIPLENGTMTLNLSTRVQKQIETAHGQVIDGKVHERLGGIHALEMLDVKRTRELVATKEEVESVRPTEEDSTPFGKFLDGMLDGENE